MTTGYEFHPEAETDLDEIWEYIAADNIDAADGVSAEIRQALENLVRYPHTGHQRTDLTNRPLRFIAARDYLIAVMHGHRHPRVMAAILRGREQPPGSFTRE